MFQQLYMKNKLRNMPKTIRGFLENACLLLKYVGSGDNVIAPKTDSFRKEILHYCSSLSPLLITWHLLLASLLQLKRKKMILVTARLC